MNKINSIISYVVFFLGLIFVACEGVDPYGEDVANSLQLSVGQSDVNFDMEHSLPVSVNASDNFGWSATPSATWVRLSPSSGVGVGNISIDVEDNPSTEKRNAIVTLKSSRYNKTASFNVEQAGTYLRIDTTSISYFPLNGGKRNVPVVSNAAWEISSCPSWITTSVKSGSAGNSGFEMEVKENKGQSRDGVVIIKNAALSYRINVTQGGVQLELGKQTMSFTNAKGSDTFTIKSNSSWTVTSNKPSWCTVDKSSGSDNATIKVSVTDNTSESSRDAIITVNAGDITKQVNVTQDGTQLKLSVDKLSYSPGSDSKTFTITSNGSWTVSSNKTSWCTVDKSSGSNNATIKVNVTANTSVSSRDAIITVKSGDITRKVNVTQEGVILNVGTDKLSFTPNSSSKTFTITSNGLWTVSSNKTSWCTVDKSSGSNNATIKVSVTDNTSVSSRDAIITIKSGDLTRQVNVTQDGIQLKLSADNLSFTSSSGSKTFTITTNYASWTVSSDKTSWCTVDKSSGSATSATIKVTVTANTSDYSRSATITVKSGSATKTMSVSQSGKESQYVSYCDLKTDYPFAFTDGFVTGWSAGSNVAYCYIKVYKSLEISSLTDSQIITKLQSEVTREPVSEVKDYIRRFSGLYSSTNYVLCTYCLDKNNNHGNLVKYSFTTLSTTAPKAEITSVKYNNSYKEWYIYLTKRYNAYSYYLYCFEGIDNYNRHEHFTAYYARKSIAQGYGSVYYTWNPNYLTYNKSSNYVAFVSWARNSSYVFGNYDYFAGYSSSAPALMPAKREPTKTSGKECESMPRMDLPPYKPAKVVVVSPIE